MISTLEVIKAGLLTTVQDIPGRNGLRKYGIPTSGALDTHHAELANWLVGNPMESPLLEITLGNAEFRFTKGTVVGVTGGIAKLYVGDRSVQTNRNIKVEPGQTLRIERVTKGARMYLSVAGDWKLKKELGSCSTYRTAELGGFNGRELRTGDRIEVDVSGVKFTEKVIPKKLMPHYSQHQMIRVMAGPEWKWLTEKQQEKILELRFGVSSTSNRMGLRLNSKMALNIQDSEFSSVPVVPGIVQLPPGGNPIVLMNDAQSVGGYPRILKVADADLWRLGQVWQGNEISFSLIDRRGALELFDYYRELRASYLT
ncbi:5-oxoprolinase subunit C family protein [Gracilimonas amylolytica]|uniref:5-oxoprolinase subunit C family protein n=1 Tax=Gracilimonas amylolytica TaxID=1749045 RepID=UPI000CD955B4|nr:biotin-dependent carboxyltransferase family protein [Gracilimonas amylolytica]